MNPDQPVPVRPRVVVVDDASQTRDTFHLAYQALEVVATFHTVESLLAAQPQADLVVLDLLLSPDLNGSVLQGPRAIMELVHHGYRVCMYTDERRLLVLARCFAAGASGMVRKLDSVADNQAAFLQVAAGQSVVPPSMVELAELLRRRRRLPELTGRQTEVLNARARGEAWDALARRLGISPKTAQDHLAAVMAKMVGFLQQAGLDPYASAADVEHALGLAPGDLNDPGMR
ncbi:MAG: LuxR C-terminal-related transcriptional regulator [Propionibacteriaceae bacterium]|nr:LuxR C-terminal-related transcriptional regulator [Propionibacteriaceae bacterium]